MSAACFSLAHRWSRGERETRRHWEWRLTGRVLQTEDFFRSANESIANKARELGWKDPVPFLCECSDSRCLGRVALTLPEYKSVRRHPQRYLVAPGHEVKQALLLEHSERVALVEKLYASA